MATVLKNFTICDNQKMTCVFDLSAYMYNPVAVEALDAAPTGFTELYDSIGRLYGYQVASAAVNTTYQLRVQALPDFGEDYQQFLLNFDLTAPCYSEIENCCRDGEVNIRWLSREGAIKEWNFPGVRSFDIRIGDANQFKNQYLQAQYSERKNIYTGKIISTGDISKEVADYLDELKYSIQAWEWDGETATPIIVNNDSFQKYKSTTKFYDVSLQYAIAEEIQVQTQ